jgi:hypothetical protein
MRSLILIAALLSTSCTIAVRCPDPCPCAESVPSELVVDEEGLIYFEYNDTNCWIADDGAIECPTITFPELEGMTIND